MQIHSLMPHTVKQIRCWPSLPLSTLPATLMGFCSSLLSLLHRFILKTICSQRFLYLIVYFSCGHPFTVCYTLNDMIYYLWMASLFYQLYYAFYTSLLYASTVLQNSAAAFNWIDSCDPLDAHILYLEICNTKHSIF